MMGKTLRTAEFVSPGHPDKFCDQVSDAILDALLDTAADRNLPADLCRTAIETLAKDNLVIVSGEMSAPDGLTAQLDIAGIVQTVWKRCGFDHAGRPTVINYIHGQASEIAALVDGEGLATGAGDQGVMCGHAFRENPAFMPVEYQMARKLISKMAYLREEGILPYLRSDAKSQVSVAADGSVHSVIISTQHDETVDLKTLRHDIEQLVVFPVLGKVSHDRMRINFKGSFVTGGTIADCGVTGRKIVCDAFGPNHPVGGGAFSGKDPSKVDRSAAYMARFIAKRGLKTEFRNANYMGVQLAFGIGSIQPEAVNAVLGDGTNVTEWVRDTFQDLSPRSIQETLGLWDRRGWRYEETAAFGHFGRPEFPWE